MKKWDILIYGDANVDLLVQDIAALPPSGEEHLVPSMPMCVGGGAANVLMGAAKLGLRTAFCGVLADDIHGRFVTEEMQKLSADTSLIRISDKHSTGISISFTNRENRCFLTLRGTNEELDVSMLTEDMMRQAGHIHLTGYAGSANHEEYKAILMLIHKMKETTVSMDVGWDDTGEWKKEIVELFPYIDVFFMNETEALHYSRKESVDEALQFFASFGRQVVIKIGSKGSVAGVRNMAEGNLQDAVIDIVQAGPFQVQAVDTTGAGDSFNAGFLYGFVKKASVEDCLTYGNACGALSVTALGGNTAFPDEAGLKAFISSRKQ